MMKFIGEMLDKFNVSSTNAGREEVLRDLDHDARQLLVGLFAL